MITEGIEAVFVETHKALGFRLEFETDHASGQLRNGEGFEVDHALISGGSDGA